MCVLETKKRLAQIEREIEELNTKISHGEAKHRSEERLTIVRDKLTARRRVEEEILAELTGEILEVEKALAKLAPYLTPLELIVITKLYVDGMKWNEVFDVLQNDPEYSQFRYEQSTYMRAHKSALNKLEKMEAQTNGGQAKDL